MSEAARPQPGADDDWDTIDEAVRDEYAQVLTTGANVLDGSDLMGRLDPLGRVLSLASDEPFRGLPSG
jgi:hypothetical protein